jgi:hypothetical protein
VVLEAKAESPAPTPTVVTAEVVEAEIRRVFGSRAAVALCIAKNESGFREKATGYNQDRVRSHDRGVFQINSYWHREVTDNEAYNYKTNIAHAYRISEGGRFWSQWSTRYQCGV